MSDYDYSHKKLLHNEVGKSPCGQNTWITAHIHVYKIFDGIVHMFVPDNCKTGNSLIVYYLYDTTIFFNRVFRFSIIPISIYRKHYCLWSSFICCFYDAYKVSSYIYSIIFRLLPLAVFYPVYDTAPDCL